MKDSAFVVCQHQMCRSISAQSDPHLYFLSGKYNCDTPGDTCYIQNSSFISLKLNRLFFFKINFFKKSFRNTIIVSNSLDSDHDLHNVGPDLDPNCL